MAGFLHYMPDSSFVDFVSRARPAFITAHAEGKHSFWDPSQCVTDRVYGIDLHQHIRPDPLFAPTHGVLSAYALRGIFTYW